MAGSSGGPVAVLEFPWQQGRQQRLPARSQPRQPQQQLIQTLWQHGSAVRFVLPKEPGQYKDDQGSHHRPPIRKELPLDWESGKIVCGVACPVCDNAMVLRRRRDGAAYFLGCTLFPGSRRCQGSRELGEVLAHSKTEVVGHL